MKQSRTIIMGLVSFAGLLLLRQECYADTDAGSADKSISINWMEEIEKGGATGYALIALSVIGLLFVVERLLNMRKKHILGDNGVQEQAAQLNADKDAAQALYHQSPSSFTKVTHHMAVVYDGDSEEAVNSAAEMAGREVESHRRRNYGLGVVATLAPLLGLLGTMIGMIEAFAKFAKLEDSSEAALVLGDSIGKALNTTAAGLIIAIIALSFYHFFKVRLGGFSDQLEAELDSVQRSWFRKNKGGE